MKGIGILPGLRLSYVDHLVPLCQILNIPILVTERSVKELIEIFYPPMEILLAEPLDFCLDPWLEPYDLFVYVDPFRLAHGHFQFVDYYSHKKARSLYCMHGNSDKKWKTYWIEQLADEDQILLYGPQSVDFLKAKGVDKNYVECGNYRLGYYIQNKRFFDEKLPFKKEKKTILYAPTWTSKNRKSEWRFEYSSFFDAHQYVFENVPDQFQLIVKMHPLYETLMSEELRQVKETFSDIHFLDHIPLIYPILSQIDIYLGDFSSIGYDFLYYQKPMFFLNFDDSTFLQKCGRTLAIDELSNLYSIIEKTDHTDLNRQIQDQVYRYAFGENRDMNFLKKEFF